MADNNFDKSRWKTAALKSKLVIQRPTNTDVCNFDDVMAIYDDEADEAIYKLNTLQDIEAAASACSSSEALNQKLSQKTGKFELNDVVLKMSTDQDQGCDQDADATTVLIKPAGVVGEKMKPQLSSANGVREREEDVFVPRKQSGFIMSAPIQLQYSQLQQHVAFAEVREFFVNDEFSRFVRTLLRAIKSDSLQAVKVMIEILKEFGFDLYEPQFRESVYTASVLHVALLFKRDEICRLLIQNFPKLVTVKYETEKFKNQTVFHIAAANGQSELLDHMLAAVDEETGIELLNTVADGSYFKKVHQGGALALTAAAYSGHIDMLRILIERGADPSVRGHRNNTVLHNIVLLSAMFPENDTPKQLYDVIEDTCLIWWQRQNNVDLTALDSENKRKMAKVDAFRHLLSIRNSADHNVLSLAVHVDSNLTMHILNTEHVYKLPQTKFGAMSWSTYDVTEIASFGPDAGTRNRYNNGSVLHILAHRANVDGDENEMVQDLIDEEPIRSVVKMKWGTYRWVYILWCIGHLLYMTCMSAVALHYYQPDLNVPDFHGPKPTAATKVNVTHFTLYDSEGKDLTNRAVHVQYLSFILFPIGTIVLELLDFFSTGYSNLKSLNMDIGKSRVKYGRYLANQWSATGNAPYRATSFLFSASTLIWLGMHFMGDDDQDIPLSLAMIFGWLFMLMFTRGCRHVCHFSIMMQKMFFQDCLYFIAVYSIFWLAFATAMHTLLFYGDTPAPDFGSTLYHMLNVITDAGDKSSSDVARIPAAAATLLSLYAVVSVVLLLNMLIAMMNSSYEAVTGSRKNVCRHQQLSIILMLERRLWWFVWLCERSQHLTWSPRLQHEKGRKTSPRIYLEITEKTTFVS